MPYFLVELRYEQRAQVDLLRPRHRDHIERLFNEGRIASAGRFSDNSGSVFLYKVDAETELLPLVETDPYIQERVAAISSMRPFEPGIATAIQYIRPE